MTTPINAADRATEEIERLEAQLRELHEDEERNRYRRSRLEAEHARLKTFIDMCELAQRFQADASPAPFEPAQTKMSVTVGLGGPFNIRLAPAPKLTRRKPDGLPFVEDMITQILGTHGSLRPHEVAALIREKWWPEIPPAHVRSILCRMMQKGKLERDGDHYSMTAAQDTEVV